VTYWHAVQISFFFLSWPFSSSPCLRFGGAFYKSHSTSNQDETYLLCPAARREDTEQAIASSQMKSPAVKHLFWSAHHNVSCLPHTASFLSWMSHISAVTQRDSPSSMDWTVAEVVHLPTMAVQICVYWSHFMPDMSARGPRAQRLNHDDSRQQGSRVWSGLRNTKAWWTEGRDRGRERGSRWFPVSCRQSRSWVLFLVWVTCFMHACLCACNMYTWKCTILHAGLNECMQSCMYVRMHVCTFLHVCMFAYMHAGLQHILNRTGDLTDY